MCAHPLLARAKQVRGEQPFVQRDMAALVERPDRRCKGLAALLALVDAGAGALAAQLGRCINATAVRTDRPIWPAEALEMRASRFLIVENRVGEIERHRNHPQLRFIYDLRDGTSSA
jgi:hypothetical protein